MVESNIHEPTDSSLLWDTVRVLTRIMLRAREEFAGLRFPFQDHTKRRDLGVLNAKGEKESKNAYKDLLKVTDKTICYAQTAAEELQGYRASTAC